MAEQATKEVPVEEPMFTTAELQEMLMEKTRENLELQQELATVKGDRADMKARALTVYQENELIKANPAIAQRKAEMDYYVAECARFIKSGAFPSLNAEQAYTLLRAGEEMGMKPLTALNSLYIIKGKIEPYGKALPLILTRAGYRIKYEHETDTGVVVHVTGPDGFDARETVDHNEKTLQKSNAMKISKINKMRFHGIRRILNFHLPHLINATADMFEREALDYKANQLNAGKGPQDALELSDKDVELIDSVTDCLEDLSREKGIDLRAAANEARSNKTAAWLSIVKAWEGGTLTAELINEQLNPQTDAGTTND